MMENIMYQLSLDVPDSKETIKQNPFYHLTSTSKRIQNGLKAIEQQQKQQASRPPVTSWSDMKVSHWLGRGGYASVFQVEWDHHHHHPKQPQPEEQQLQEEQHQPSLRRKRSNFLLRRRSSTTSSSTASSSSSSSTSSLSTKTNTKTHYALKCLNSDLASCYRNTTTSSNNIPSSSSSSSSSSSTIAISTRTTQSFLYAVRDLVIEGELLSQLSHPNIITLHATYGNGTGSSSSSSSSVLSSYLQKEDSMGYFLVLDLLHDDTLHDRIIDWNIQQEQQLKVSHRNYLFQTIKKKTTTTTTTPFLYKKLKKRIMTLRSSSHSPPPRNHHHHCSSSTSTTATTTSSSSSSSSSTISSWKQQRQLLKYQWFMEQRIETIIVPIVQAMMYLHNDDDNEQQSAHQHHQQQGGGILLRDLKPENIGFDRSTNQIKLFDFGLARRITNKSSSSRSATTRTKNECDTVTYNENDVMNDMGAGSLKYMAPECFQYQKQQQRKQQQQQQQKQRSNVVQPILPSSKTIQTKKKKKNKIATTTTTTKKITTSYQNDDDPISHHENTILPSLTTTTTSNMNIFKIDVYSFGILLWQVVTLSPSPYPTIHTRHQLYTDVIQGGIRPSISEIYQFTTLRNVIESCWNPNPEQRPTFQEIYQQLQDMIHQYHHHDPLVEPPQQQQQQQQQQGGGQRDKKNNRTTKSQSSSSLLVLPPNTTTSMSSMSCSSLSLQQQHHHHHHQQQQLPAKQSTCVLRGSLNPTEANEDEGEES